MKEIKYLKKNQISAMKNTDFKLKGPQNTKRRNKENSTPKIIVTFPETSLPLLLLIFWRKSRSQIRT